MFYLHYCSYAVDKAAKSSASDPSTVEIEDNGVQVLVHVHVLRNGLVAIVNTYSHIVVQLTLSMWTRL